MKQAPLNPVAEHGGIARTELASGVQQRATQPGMSSQKREQPGGCPARDDQIGFIDAGNCDVVPQMRYVFFQTGRCGSASADTPSP